MFYDVWRNVADREKGGAAWRPSGYKSWPTQGKWFQVEVRQLEQCHIKQVPSPHLLNHLITAVCWKFLQILDNYDRLLNWALHLSMVNHDSEKPPGAVFTGQKKNHVPRLAAILNCLNIFMIISKKTLIYLNLKVISRNLNFTSAAMNRKLIFKWTHM